MSSTWNFLDARYDDTVDICECGGIITTPGAKTCKACIHKEHAARDAAAYQARKLARHKIRQFWLSRPDPIASFVCALRWRLWRAVGECRR